MPPLSFPHCTSSPSVLLYPVLSLSRTKVNKYNMGIDFGGAGGSKGGHNGGRTKNTNRKAAKTQNVYVRLLCKLYEFLSRRTDSQFNKVVLKRLRMSRVNQPVMSLTRVLRFAKKSGENVSSMYHILWNVWIGSCPCRFYSLEHHAFVRDICGCPPLSSLTACCSSMHSMFGFDMVICRRVFLICLYTHRGITRQM